MRKPKNLFIFIIYMRWNFSLSSKIGLISILDKPNDSIIHKEQNVRKVYPIRKDGALTRHEWWGFLMG
jgi:hypothetical protein